MNCAQALAVAAAAFVAAGDPWTAPLKAAHAQIDALAEHGTAIGEEMFYAILGEDLPAPARCPTADSDAI